MIPTPLNNSLSDIDIRYTSANGAEWSPRGADTWNPFSGLIKGALLVKSAWNTPYECYSINTDGTVWHKLNPTLAEIAEHSDLVLSFTPHTSGSQGQFSAAKAVVAKSGYYSKNNGYEDIINYYTAGDDTGTITYSWQTNPYIVSVLIYFGETNPFE